MTTRTVNPVLFARKHKDGEWHCGLCPFHTAVLKLLDYHMSKHSEPGRWTSA